MENVREMLETSSGEKRYDLAINYMQQRGIAFTAEMPDYRNVKYRIMTGGSSIHVRNKYFKLY